MLNSFTKREQSLLAVILFAVGLSVLFYMYVFTPKSETITEQGAHVDALASANQKAANELKAGNLRQLKEDAARYAENLAVMRQLVPTVNEVPGLLEQVSNSARRVGLDIASVTPQAVASGGEGSGKKKSGGLSFLARFQRKDTKDIPLDDSAPAPARPMIAAAAGIAVAIAVLGVGGGFWYQDRQLASLDEHLQQELADSARFSAVIGERKTVIARRDSLISQLGII